MTGSGKTAQVNGQVAGYQNLKYSNLPTGCELNGKL